MFDSLDVKAKADDESSVRTYNANKREAKKSGTDFDESEPIRQPNTIKQHLRKLRMLVKEATA